MGVATRLTLCEKNRGGEVGGLGARAAPRALLRRVAVSPSDERLGWEKGARGAVYGLTPRLGRRV